MKQFPVTLKERTIRFNNNYDYKDLEIDASFAKKGSK